MSHSSLEKAARFLAIAPQFKLGDLPTESRHPLTQNLSALANNDLPRALDILKQVELNALKALDPNLTRLEALRREIAETLAHEGRIFLCGCGATGRLSLSLETLWRENFAGHANEGKVISFIAGADYALVRSIENFEDHPEYGAQQLHDLGFREGDLLVSTTEGGETPFVIGATEEATRLSKRKPWFLFCNPESSLQDIERSRSVFENPNIEKVSLFTGPMAIAGSTRLQASTVLMLAVGAAMFSHAESNEAMLALIRSFSNALSSCDFDPLEPLIVEESRIYREGERCVHVTDHYAMTIITDTTERSPTFSLAPFENALEENPIPSWTYLAIPSASNQAEAWRKLLRREPRPLEWPGFVHRFGAETVAGFDFSREAIVRREKLLGKVHQVRVDRNADELTISTLLAKATFKRPNKLLTEHLLLKVIMNVCSTLTMGRLGRFESNLMLYVKASNNKLIDRSIRFIRALCSDRLNVTPSYEETCHALFETLEHLSPEEPAVLKTVEMLERKLRK